MKNQRVVVSRFGDRVLIHGASGGCGTALLQLGRQMQLKMEKFMPYSTASEDATCSARIAA